MIFDQNRQTVTRRNRSYVAKLFDLFWTKRALLGPWNYLATRLMIQTLNFLALGFKILIFEVLFRV